MKKLITLILVSVLLVLSMMSCSKSGVSNNVSTAPCGNTALIGCWVANNAYTETSIDGGKATTKDETDIGWNVMQLFSDGTGVVYYPDLESDGTMESIDKKTFTWHAENDAFYMSNNNSDFYTLSDNKLTIIDARYSDYNISEYDDNGEIVEEIQVEYLYERKECVVFERSNKTLAELLHEKYVEYVNSQK